MTFGAFPCSRAAPWQLTLSLASMQLTAYGVSVYPNPVSPDPSPVIPDPNPGSPDTQLRRKLHGSETKG